MKAAHPEVVAATRINPGETLRQARESKQWSIAEVAQKLNLPVLALSNLEAGAFDKLPGTTFARGYIRAYAKLLEMDQTPLVQQFDQYTGTDASGSNVHSLGRIEEPVRLSHNILRFVSFLVLVGLLGGGFALWQDKAPVHESEQPGIPMGHVVVDSSDGTTQIHPLDEPEDLAATEGQKPEEPVTPGQPGALPGSTPAPGTSGAAAGVPAAGTSAAAEGAATSTHPAATPGTGIAAPATAPASVAGGVPKPPVQAPLTTPKPAAVPSTPVAAAQPAAGDGSLSLQFTADCWIQVIDANNKVLLSGLKRKGESASTSGKPPLKLRLGVAHAAQVTYNGQAVDVTPFTSGDTARITLGQ